MFFVLGALYVYEFHARLDVPTLVLQVFYDYIACYGALCGESLKTGANHVHQLCSL